MTDAELSEIARAVTTRLKQVSDAVKGAAIFKRTISNLASLVQSVAELRG